MLRPIATATFLFFTTLLLITSGEALACRCAEYGPTRAARDRADLVVSGVVSSVILEGRIDRTFVIDVDRVIKGDVGAATPARISINLGTTSCRLTELAEGETWVIFAQRDAKGLLTTRRCMGSTRLAAAGASINDAQRKTLDRLSPAK